MQANEIDATDGHLKIEKYWAQILGGDRRQMELV